LLHGFDVVLQRLTDSYGLLEKETARDAKSPKVAGLIGKLTTDALDFLSSCRQVPLVSRVPNKSYFAFSGPGKKPRLSRTNAQILLLRCAFQVCTAC
jgi:hypothetical protein